MSAIPNLARPIPPDELWDVDACDDFTHNKFIPDEALTQWIRNTFIEGSGPLVHETHEHLQHAFIGCLWTNAMNKRNMNEIVGMAEVPFPQGGRWQKARAKQQLREWFGQEPDFLLTFYAPYATVIDDATWCALVEHELCHCAQVRDDEGVPKFDDDGKPVFGMRGHDVEEFVHVVARYGVHSASGRTLELVNAALMAPSVAQADIAVCCGTKGCNLRLVA